MDHLDIRILRLLVQGQARCPLNPDFRESFAAIARKVGADPDTVRHRVKKLHESGFLEGWRLFVNPRIWGGGQVLLLLDVEPTFSKEALVEELELVPGVMIIDCFYGRLGITLSYEDEISLPRQIELVRRICDARDAFVARWPFPKCTAVLSVRDWDLIRALRQNPRKTFAVLAKEVGLSSRTVKAKLSRFVREGIAFAWPSLNLRRVDGGVVAWLFVLCPSERKSDVDEAVRAHLDDYIWHVTHLLPYRPDDLQPCGFNLVVPNISIAGDIESWAKVLPGVRLARVELHEVSLSHFESYNGDLDRRLKQVATALPTGTAGKNRRRVPVPRHA